MCQARIGLGYSCKSGSERHRRIKKADEMKAMSRVVMRGRESSEEETNKIIDFQWQIAQIVERHERQRLLEQDTLNSTHVRLMLLYL